MQSESWCKIWCDECGTANWICEGDISDCSRCDPEGFICYKCSAVWPFLEEDPGDPECYEVGLEKPV